MIKTGLLSITFRKLSWEQVLHLAAEAGLDAIEWGGDIHVPHGDIERAAEVGRRTREAGLEIASYGSYYYAGNTEKGKPFEAVLSAAVALQAPAIRVWAGDRGSDVSDALWRTGVVEDTRRIAELAAREGISIDFEYHRNTLTDTAESAIALLRDIDHPNVRCNWQPPYPGDFEASRRTLDAVLPWLANVHVFHWLPGQRLPLSEGKADWQQYVSVIAAQSGKPYMMLEFVKDDSPEQFRSDAETLLALL